MVHFRDRARQFSYSVQYRCTLCATYRIYYITAKTELLSNSGGVFVDFRTYLKNLSYFQIPKRFCSAGGPFGAGVKVTKKRAQNEKFYSFFFKKSREWRGQSPGVRIESGHLKNRLPAVRRGRHFPQAGNRAFSQVVRLFFVAAHRLPLRKAITSENCGFVLRTKCGPCRTARKQFSRGCEADRRAAAPKKYSKGLRALFCCFLTA